jgi:hypothetical protein
MMLIDILRVSSTAAGAIVMLMWLAGVLGLADFALLFRVAP